MAIDATSPRSRRALLGAAIGAGAATVASALGRPEPVLAGVDGDVVLGMGNNATTATSITNSTTSTTVFQATSTGAGTALYGYSLNYLGVYGESSSSTGVFGFSYSGTGVYGYSVASFGSPPAGPAKTGVYGFANEDTSSRGVTGQTTTGRGVNGVATTGTAGYFATTDPLHGYALRAVGRVKLDKCSGVATIAAGAKSVVVTPGIDLTPTTAVVASLMGSAGGTTTVHRSSVSTTANTFTIYLTANSTVAVKVAWHVFG